MGDILKILIYGAGGHGQVVADILLCMRRSDQTVVTLGFIDDNPDKKSDKLHGLPVVGGITVLRKIEHDGVIIAIGDNITRKKVFNRLESAGERFVSAIHPSAVLASDVLVGTGCMICAGVVVNTGSVIGEHVILNTSCSVDHHNKIESFVHIAPGVHLGGEVTIGQGAMLGIGSCVLPGTSVGEWALVGGGAVVRKDIPPNVLAAGNPCRIIKTLSRHDGDLMS
jgi:sugar O-acyltransferase (sialic acid O-acetyltransferase NeuD family)